MLTNKPTKLTAIRKTFDISTDNLIDPPDTMPASLPIEMHGDFNRMIVQLRRTGNWRPEMMGLLEAYLHHLYHFRLAAENLEQFGAFDEEGKPREAGRILSAHSRSMASLAKAMGIVVTAASIAPSAHIEARPQSSVWS